MKSIVHLLVLEVCNCVVNRMVRTSALTKARVHLLEGGEVEGLLQRISDIIHRHIAAVRTDTNIH